MSEEIIVGALAAAAGYFFGGFFGLLQLPFTTRQRNADAAVKEAKAASITVESFERLMSQNIETQQQLMTTTTTFTQYVMDTRKRNDEREEKHATQVRALEKSLIDSQEQIKDLTERIENLNKNQDSLKLEVSLKDRNTTELSATISNLNKTIAEQGKRITWLEESEKQAHKLVGEKEVKIVELEKRIRELETELAHIKAQQNQPPAISALVAAIVEPADPAAKAEHPAPRIPEPPVVADESRADVVANEPGVQS